MKQPWVLFLAAGIGSRYGGIKQLDSFGPHGETIIDYSIYDAKKSGFKHFAFVIREEIEADFYNKVLKKWQGKIEYTTILQRLDDNPLNIKLNRSKPLGTGHAVYSARNVIDSTFITLNADDLYGFNALKSAYNWIQNPKNSNQYALVAYQLNKTLSKTGSVNRGMCLIKDKDHIDKILETLKIHWQDGTLIGQDINEKTQKLDPNTPVSLNLYILQPEIFVDIKEQLTDFLKQNADNPKAEFFLPNAVNYSKQKRNYPIKLITTTSTWKGVTYKEDAKDLKEFIVKCIRRGVYPERLG